jgi:hypothetical protein
VDTNCKQSKRKKEKSLGQLCLQFIALFLNESRELSLEQAANLLSSQIIQEDHKMKTKVLLQTEYVLDKKTI